MIKVYPFKNCSVVGFTQHNMYNFIVPVFLCATAYITVARDDETG